MNGYIEQKGCYCCKWVFIREDYDEPNEYYCNSHDSGPRPLCLSVYGEEWDRLCDAWNKWSTKYSVAPWGICNKWEKL